MSCIPVAFPTGDAISLSHSVVMYACNKNVDLAIQHGRKRPPGSMMPQAKSALISYGGQRKIATCSSLRLSIFTPNVLMISKHSDGSLNQWTVSFAEDSAFSTVLSVSHKSRYCGHRFHLNDLACHSLLPLLLTTSHHNALKTPEVDIIRAQDTLFPSFFDSSSQPNRSIQVSQDPNAIYSELILWRVDPVGPLSLSGGVSELARINSLHASAFANVAWLPTLIPSSCLGETLFCFKTGENFLYLKDHWFGESSLFVGVSTGKKSFNWPLNVHFNMNLSLPLLPPPLLLLSLLSLQGVYCNSPSACFVASDGHSLRLYQAVIEAKKLLSELSNPEISVSPNKVQFNCFLLLPYIIYGVINNQLEYV